MTAMIDVSDGLSTDMGHICLESRVGAVIRGPRVPVSPAARRLARSTGRTALWHALHDGEDFELLFTVDKADAPGVPARIGSTAVTRIGVVRRGSRVMLQGSDGRLRVLKAEGYEHHFGA